MDKILIPENFIIVGNKDIRDYVTVLTKIHRNHQEIILASRGKNISKLVDLALIAEESFEFKIVDWKAKTEILPARDDPNHAINISNLQITIKNHNGGNNGQKMH